MNKRRQGGYVLQCGVVLGVFLGSILGEASAVAGECAAPKGATAALAEQDVAARLQFIRDTLQEAERRERQFLIGWGITYAGFAGGAWVLVPTSDDPRKRVDAIWSSSTSVAGALLMIIEPLSVMKDRKRFDRLMAAPAQPAPEQSPQVSPRCRMLAQAEALMTHAALSEAGAKRTFSHFSSLVVNVGLGLALGYGLKRPETAAQNTTIGIVVSELMIASRPTVAAERLELYRAGRLDAPIHRGWFLLPSMTPTEGGMSMSVAGTF